MTSYERSIVTMGLSRAVSEIDGDFSRTLLFFSQPRVFLRPADGVPLGIEHGAMGQKTRMMGLSGGRKRFQIDLAV